jgi:hypothetical protein
MRNLILLILLVFCKCDFRSQSYIAFPDSNAKWNMTPGGIGTPVVIYSVKGDSVFNSYTYKKYYMVSDTGANPVSSEYFAMVRQDIASKRIYGILAGTNAEKKMYDFNLNVNDTVSVYCFHWMPGAYKLKVIAKDSILLDGQYRKRLRLVSYPTWPEEQEHWIEGIGSSYGPFSSGLAANGMICVCYPKLLCYKQNGNLKYIDPGFFSCFANGCPNNGLIDLSLQNDFLILSNPIQNYLNIEGHSKFQGEKTLIEIVDASGRLVFKENSSFEGGKISVDVQKLPKGIYFLKLYQETKVLTAKKIIKE